MADPRAGPALMVLPRDMNPLGHGPDSEVDTRGEEALRTADDTDTAFEFKRPAWHDRAICTPDMTDLFFEPINFDAAKAVCAGCPVKLQCRDYALDHHEKWGVWGGLDPRQRRQARR